jgi:hypothetical protein
MRQTPGRKRVRRGRRLRINLNDESEEFGRDGAAEAKTDAEADDSRSTGADEEDSMPADEEDAAATDCDAAATPEGVPPRRVCSRGLRRRR